MAFNFRKFFEGIRIVPKTTSTVSEMGDLDVTSGDGKLNYYDGTISSPVVTESGTATLTNKTIDGGSNTITNVGNGSINGPIDRSKLAAGTPNVVLVNDGSGLLADSSVTTTQLNQLSGVTGSITSDTNTQTLSNKTLDDSTIATFKDANLTIEDDSDTTKKVQFQLSGVTTGTTRTLSVPNATTTLVGNDNTQTLSNKTIAAGSNTITGLTNTNISAGANIDAAKLGTGAVDTTHLNYLQNVTSDIQTQLNAKQATITVLPIANGGTGQSSASAAFDALSPNTTKGDITVRTSTSNVRQAIGSDGQVLVADASQTNGLKWANVQAGTKNYITFNNFENNATTGWSLFNTTLTSGIPTGSITAGAASINTFNIVNSGQLAGSFSLQTVANGTWNAGQGFITDALTIDKEDQAKVLSFKFYYSVPVNPTNGNFSGTSSNTFAVYIYDVTNSAWIQPAGVYGMTQNSGVGLCSGSFQTTSSSTQYRLAILAVNGSSSTITLFWDDFFLGPQTAPIGAVATDWVPYSLTIGGQTSAPTKASSPTFDNARWRRVGDSMEIFYHYAHSSATGSAAGTGTYEFPIPAGYAIDQTKLDTSSSGEANVGSANANTTASANLTGWVGTINTTQLVVVVGDETTGPAPLSSTNNAITNASVDYSFTAKVPIVGWSSNVQMSNDTDTRVVEVYAYQSTNQTLSTNNTNQKLTIDSLIKDTHGGFDATNNRYVIPVSGIYQFTGKLSLGNTNILNARYDVRLGINGTVTYVGPNIIFNAASALQTLNCTFPTIALNAGDFVELYAEGAGNNSVSTYTTSSGSPNTFLSGFRLSGPSVIAATESVNCKITGSSISGTVSTTFAGSGSITWDASPAFDSHSGYNGSTTYTIPVSGVYEIYASVLQTGTEAADQLVQLCIAQNGTQKDSSYTRLQASGLTATFHAVDGLLKCIAGDAITLRLVSQTTGAALAGSGNNIFWTIVRVGN